jgi:hypothetical protein
MWKHNNIIIIKNKNFLQFGLDEISSNPYKIRIRILSISLEMERSRLVIS